MWLRGIELNEAPTPHTVVAEELAVPAQIEIDRGQTLLVLTCEKEGFASHTHAFTPRKNVATSAANLADPTFILGDVIDSQTGAAFYHANEIVVQLTLHAD